MCGIAGLYQFRTSRTGLEATAAAMAAAMEHRGPDDSGVWKDAESPLALAHRRLSIIDLTPEGRQPMASASGRYVIVFNGEVYNFPDLQRALEARGHAFRGRSDTEVMLAAIEEWGLNPALQKFNGMFAFALWDRKERQLHLVRDRLGKKPLYVGWAGDTLLFASELKAFRAHPAFAGEISRNVLQLYMRYSYIPAPHCVYEGVWTLPAGCRLAVDPGALEPGQDLGLRMEPYWHHTRILEEARARMDGNGDEAATDECEELLKRCVGDRMVSDVPLGAFLSGGIDSSTVVALMQQQSAQPVKTYTIGFHEAGFDEAAHARKVAAHLGTDHQELYLTAREAMEVVPRLPEIYDEPFADISAIPTFLVAQFARRDVTVALSGDGGDEMFGGYSRHVQGPQIYRRLRMTPAPLRRWLARRIEKRGTSELDRLAPGLPQLGDKLHKVASVLPLSSPEEIYKRLLGHCADPSEIVEGGREPEILLFASEHRAQTTLSFAERMMAGDALSYLPNDILVKVDRASMAVSLEARAPLLDRRVYEYAWTLPERFKVRDGKGKWLLRQVLARHVPAALFERPKQGFSMPVGEWLRGDLRDWAEDLLGENRLKLDGYLNPEAVRSLWSAHLAGQGGRQTLLWNILMFQAWLRHGRAK
ncbi:MAG: asparagine synthase (glutamine-hydrolyzing) [Alphaproteobacteria bacterium]|nr:asparagine synthase (glutamine-hydrolyzing) [Alphaproteobacteria bacterium]